MHYNLITFRHFTGYLLTYAEMRFDIFLCRVAVFDHRSGTLTTALTAVAHLRKPAGLAVARNLFDDEPAVAPLLVLVADPEAHAVYVLPLPSRRPTAAISVAEPADSSPTISMRHIDSSNVATACIDCPNPRRLGAATALSHPCAVCVTPDERGAVIADAYAHCVVLCALQDGQVGLSMRVYFFLSCSFSKLSVVEIVVKHGRPPTPSSLSSGVTRPQRRRSR